VFNFVLKDIRSLPISVIVDYIFHKCNEYFMNVTPCVTIFPNYIHYKLNHASTSLVNQAVEI
jgi:hypothetical protein